LENAARKLTQNPLVSSLQKNPKVLKGDKIKNQLGYTFLRLWTGTIETLSCKNFYGRGNPKVLYAAFSLEIGI